MELLERWRRVPVAIAADVSGGKVVIDPAIRPLLPPGQQPKLFGKAVTAICQPPDFGAVLCALDVIKSGEVLVIDAQGNRDHAMIGEILGGHLHRKGCAGVVCDGAVRDVAELAQMKGFSVFARSITPRGPTATAGTKVNSPAWIGGKGVNPGDLIIGDDDGLCVLSPEFQVSLIDKAEAKLTLEEEWQSKLKAGMSVAQVFGLKI